MGKLKWTLGLILIAGLLITLLPTPVQAQSPIDLELGGNATTGWNVSNIMPGDSGTKTVELHNAGSRHGFVTIWVSDINETDYAGNDTDAALGKYLLFNLSCEPSGQLKTNLNFPAKISELPQSASDANYIRITRLNAGETITLNWQWQFPETGEPQNEAQGDSLSFTINYMLEEFPPTGGGGGGGGGTPYYVQIDLFGVVESYPISWGGELQKAIEATSPDGMLTVNIPKGTIALDKYGKRLKELEVAVNESPPSPPGNAHIIGPAYDFGPAGATFSPPITLTFTYDPPLIPEGVVEENLVIAYYNEDSSQWIELDSVVDTEKHIISAKVSQFTTFAIIGAITPSTPAAFTLSSLIVSPTEVDIGEMVTISISVANTGGQAGSCKVRLKINGVVEATKEVTVNPGFSKEVIFTVSKDIAGIYSVDVDGSVGSFMVKEKVVPPILKPINWPLIGGIIGGVIAVGLLVYFLVVRKRTRRIL